MQNSGWDMGARRMLNAQSELEHEEIQAGTLSGIRYGSRVHFVARLGVIRQESGKIVPPSQ